MWTNKENILQFFPQTGPNRTKFTMTFVRSEMTPPFLKFFFPRKIMTKIAVFKAKKIAMNFFRSKMTPPPPSEIFRKFIRFAERMLPLVEDE